MAQVDEDVHREPIERKLRSAAWRGAGELLSAQVAFLLLAAIVFPIFAKARSYSGPGMGPYRIADAIFDDHRATGGWPDSVDALRPYLHRYPTYKPYAVSFVRLDSKEQVPIYAVSVNGVLQTYRFPTDDRPEKTSRAIVPVDLNAPRR